MKLSKKLLLALSALAIFAVLLLPIRSSVAAPQYEQAKNTKTCDGLSFFCTTLDSATDFISGFYESVVASKLVVEPELFSSNYSGSTGYALKSAWKIFRGLANAVLVVALLIIIISQITGMGISNYGIKKGLPKLLIAVLAVNLSYYFCQACIDIANILGAGIGDFFEGLLDQATPPGVTLDTNGTWLTTIFLGIGVGILVKQKALAVKIIIGVLILVVIFIVAMFMLYVILALRQSLCILLVIFSPVAFVSYMVPGGKKLFELWKNSFKAVLMAYPICSLLVYGGAFAGAVLYSSWALNGANEFFSCIGFLIIATVPYFFIPSTIFKGLGILEDVSHKISGIVSKNSRSFLENSRLMQSQRLKDQRLREINRSGQYVDRNGVVRNRIGYGHKFSKWKSPTSGPFKGARQKIVNARNSAVSTISGSAINQRLVRWNKGRAAPHMRSAASAISAMRRQDKYHVRKKNMKEINGRGELVNSYGADGKRVHKGFYYKKKPDGSIVVKPKFGFMGSLDYYFHSTVGLRFENAKMMEAEYLKLANSTYTEVQKKAYSDYRMADMGAGGDKKGAELDVMIKGHDTARAQVALRDLLDEGEAGRDTLQAILENAAASTSDEEFRAYVEFAKSMSRGDLDKIKKKNPKLYQMLMNLRNDDGVTKIADKTAVTDAEVSFGVIEGMSKKQFGEMDGKAQTEVVDHLVKVVEDDAAGKGTNPYGLKAVDSEEVILAVTLAEGALNDPDIRANLSAANIARLEHIVELRNNELRTSSAANSKEDSASLLSVAGSLSPTDASFEGQYLDGLKSQFGQKNPGKPDNFVEAMMSGDTVRMESIMQSIDRDIDRRLSDAGITDTKERSLKRNTILLKAVGALSSCDGSGIGGSMPVIDGGLYGDAADKIISKAKKNTATAADKQAAEQCRRAREAVEMLEQRFARRMSNSNG